VRKYVLAQALGPKWWYMTRRKGLLVKVAVYQDWVAVLGQSASANSVLVKEVPVFQDWAAVLVKEVPVYQDWAAVLVVQMLRPLTCWRRAPAAQNT
jgi:hypothetical protein